MHVGICTLYLRLLSGRSLKEKRRVVKSIKDKLRGKFNVSVAEIDSLDKWQLATLGVACVSNDTRFTNSMLSSVVSFVGAIHAVELVDYEIEIQ